jgi:hypothetical protein
VIPPCVALPEVEIVHAETARVEVAAADADVAQPAVDAVAVDVAVPEVVVFVVLVFASEVAWLVAFAAPASAFGVAEPRASADTHVVFPVLLAAAAAGVWPNNLERSISSAFPNIGYSARSSSSAEAANRGPFDNSICDPANRADDSKLSNGGLRRNRIAGLPYSMPNRGHSSVSGTSRPRTVSTTSHSRKTGPPLCKGQRTQHWCPALRQLLAARQIRSVAARY